MPPVYLNELFLSNGVIMAAGFAPGSHWRDSARSARFFMVDARAAFPIFFFLMHIRVWTGILVLASAFFFGIIEHYAIDCLFFFVRYGLFLQGTSK